MGLSSVECLQYFCIYNFNSITHFTKNRLHTMLNNNVNKMMLDPNHPHKAWKYFKYNSVGLSDLMQKSMSGKALNDQLQILFRMQCDNMITMYRRWRRQQWQQMQSISRFSLCNLLLQLRKYKTSVIDAAMIKIHTTWIQVTTLPKLLSKGGSWWWQQSPLLLNFQLKTKQNETKLQHFF